MSRKTIPSRTVYTCDRCGATGEALHSGAFEFEYTDLKITTGGKDCMGNTGGGKLKVNLCGACSVAFWDWLKKKENP